MEYLEKKMDDILEKINNLETIVSKLVKVQLQNYKIEDNLNDDK